MALEDHRSALAKAGRVAQKASRRFSSGFGRTGRRSDCGQNAPQVPLDHRWTQGASRFYRLFPGPWQGLGDMSGGKELNVGQPHDLDPVLFVLGLGCLRGVQQQALSQKTVGMLLIEALSIIVVTLFGRDDAAPVPDHG